jgi:chloramphenicol 3-O-phosphotransferase
MRRDCAQSAVSGPTRMPPGKIILINGASSAGKTARARASIRR